MLGLIIRVVGILFVVGIFFAKAMMHVSPAIKKPVSEITKHLDDAGHHSKLNIPVGPEDSLPVRETPIQDAASEAILRAAARCGHDNEGGCEN